MWACRFSCCRSSVVEHFIGNEEVHSSILCGSTTTFSSPMTFQVRADDIGPPASLHRQMSQRRRAADSSTSGLTTLIGLPAQ
jgi:hypothetical protein